VILIIAMTIIAVLGAGFISLVGSKHRGFLHQRDSYRALNLANAGVEYAIRYVGDSINPSPNTNDFFHNPTIYPNVPVVSSLPDTANLSSAQWKKIDFPDVNGSFYLSYYLSATYPDDSESNKILYSVGVSGTAQRIVKLKRFLGYASPSTTGLGALNLVPNSRPRISGNYVVVPVINMYEPTIRISSIEFEVNLTNNLTKEFRDISFNSVNQSSGAVVYYTYSSYSYTCSSAAEPPPACRRGNYIEIPDNGPKTASLNMSGNVDIPGYSIRWFFFRFNESGSDLRGIYEMKFNFSSGDSATIRFDLPYP